MGPVNFIALSAADITTSPKSIPIPTNNVYSISVQGKVTGTSPTGTLKLQASNDFPLTGSPTTWTDIPSATVAVSATGSYLIPKTDVCYAYVQLIWVTGSGTGTVTATVKTIGF